jgi:hypothetical protein
MSNHTPPSLFDRLWQGVALLFGIVIVLWLALQLLAQYWGWLLLIVIVVGLIVASVAWLRSRPNRW